MIVIWIYGQPLEITTVSGVNLNYYQIPLIQKDNEGPSVLSPQGDEIYFTRCPRMKKVDLGCEIFYSKRKGDSWTQAKKNSIEA